MRAKYSGRFVKDAHGDRTMTPEQQERFSRFCLIAQLMHKKAEKECRKVNADDVFRAYTIYSHGKSMNAIGQIRRLERVMAS